MAIKDKRFELRLDEQTFDALKKLADRNEIDRSKLVAGMIRRSAKRAKLWSK